MGLEFAARNRAAWSIRHHRLPDGLASLLRHRFCTGEILFSSSLLTRSASKPAKRRKQFTPCDDSLGSGDHPRIAASIEARSDLPTHAARFYGAPDRSGWESRAISVATSPPGSMKRKSRLLRKR